MDAPDAPQLNIEEPQPANENAPDVIEPQPDDVAGGDGEIHDQEPIDADAGEIGEEGEFEEMEVDEYMDAASLPRLDSDIQVLDPASLPIPGQVEQAPSGTDLLPEPGEPVPVVAAAAVAAAPLSSGSPESLPAAEPPQAISVGDNRAGSPESEGQISSDNEEDVLPVQPSAFAGATHNVAVSDEKLDDDLENLEDRLYGARLNVENLSDQIYSLNEQVTNYPDSLDLEEMEYVFEQILTCLDDIVEVDQAFDILQPGIRENALRAIEKCEAQLGGMGGNALATNIPRLRQIRAELDEWFDLPSVHQLKPLYNEPQEPTNDDFDDEAKDTIEPVVAYDTLVDHNALQDEGWGYVYQPEIPPLELASFAVPATVIPALPSNSGIIPLMDVQSGLSVNDFPSLTDVTARQPPAPEPYHPPLPSRSNQSIHAVKTSSSTTAAIPSLLDIEVSFPLEILKRSSSQVYAPRGKMGAFAKEFLEDDDAPTQSSPSNFHRTPVAVSEADSTQQQQTPPEEGETTSRPPSSSNSHTA